MWAVDRIQSDNLDHFSWFVKTKERTKERRRKEDVYAYAIIAVGCLATSSAITD